MRYFFIIPLFFIASCSEQKQQSDNKFPEIDTAKLFDPYPQKDLVDKTDVVLSNCITLDENDSIAVAIGGERKELKNIDGLRDALKNYSDEGRNYKLYIIYVNGTSFKRIVEVIDILKTFKIENYKAINLTSLNTPLYEPIQK